MRKRLAFSLLLPFMAAVPFAHSQIDSSGGSFSQQGGGQAIDCSSPSAAGSPFCGGNLTGQNPFALDNYGGYGNQSGMNGSYGQFGTGIGFGGERNVPSGSPLSSQTYNDNTDIGRTQVRQPSTVPAPPEPLTDFQKYVAATSGEVLPIFGASLFQNVPSTFAPVDQIPVTPDYVFGPGDELRVRIWGQVNFNANVRIDRSGNIYLPQVGAVHVAGLPFSDLDKHLRTEIGRVYRNFDLTVDAGQLRSIQVFVVGQARRPGSYTVSSLSTLVNALFSSGGPSATGSLRHIQVKRDGKVITDFDLYDLLTTGNKSKDVPLLQGDVIFIPPAGPQVALTGAVRHPAIFELRDADTSIQQVLSDAGGASNIASSSRISIDRIENRQARAAMEVAYDSTGLATPLHDGDVVRVLSIVPRFEKTITLRGNIANPGNFAWHPGMKLSDLIPDRESLLTRDYWWRRSQLGLPTPEFQPFVAGPVQNQPQYPVDLQSQQAYQQWQLQNSMVKLPNGQYAPVTPPTVTGPDGQPVPQQPKNSVATEYPYTQGNVYLQGTPPVIQQNNSTTTGSTSYYSPYSYQQQQAQQNAALTAAQQASAGSLGGKSGQVITQNTASATHKTDVRLAAPEIDWDYAVIQRMDPATLKTSLLPFHLGRLVMDHDPAEDLPLQPGDIVSIFSQADIRVPLAQQTKFVRLDGEFAAAGIYSVLPGETLRQLVARAGGLTPGAYLYGSEFSRESTRVLQQQRIDEYVQSLELAIQRGAIAQASSAVTPQDSAAVAAAQGSARDLLNRLHQIRATGRIVLKIDSANPNAENLPDMPLEDGDVFTIPPRPATVNVVGSVYDQNSFIFQSDRRVGDYLKLAGGPNRDADKKHMFIVRADGSVISKTTTSGVWGNNFEAIRLNPGDSIVVPEKTLRGSILRGILDWSQVFSQFALGAAVVNAL